MIPQLNDRFAQQQQGAESYELEFDTSQDFSPERTLSAVVAHAVQIGASDIFFSSNEGDVEVSARHLGVIRRVAGLPVEVGFRCIAHTRAMANIKFGEKGHPQDGRWVFRLPNDDIVDLRINTMPTLYGECVAIRILERDSHLRNLEALGLVGSQLGSLLSLLHRPTGLILVTGPTGSGKTTTLYGCLHYLNDGRRKIHTIEDPIEYAVPGLHQTNVDEARGATLAELLRGVVRQGPDVIMIGEVRDKATAETAVRAANSGQLVFATLHAPVASAAVQSMLGMGVSPYMLSSSLSAVLGQRLIRTLNPAARVPVDLTDAPRTFEEVEPWLADGQGKIVYAAPTDGNGSEGYVARTGIFELMTLTPRLRKMIVELKSANEVARAAIDEGMIDFRRAALLKVAEGATTFDEMYRVLPSEEVWGET